MMTKFIITFGILATTVATYVYLDWGVMQILGVWIVLVAVNTANENGPVWRRALLVSLAFSLMVLGHFVISDNFMYWGALLLSCVLFIVSFTCLHYLFNAEPGAGSTLTFAFLGIIITAPIAIYVLYEGMNGLGYW